MASETYQYMPRAEPIPGVEYPLSIMYCGVCTLPIEYCEFSSAPDKCREWLSVNLPDGFGQLKVDDSNGAVASDQAGVDGQAAAKTRQVRGGKGTNRKPVKQRISVFKTSRGKKKYTTSVMGLSTFGIDLKVASKAFGQKFATGSSVTGNGDEIVIQGDVKEDLIDMLTDKWPEIHEDSIEDLGEMKR